MRYVTLLLLYLLCLFYAFSLSAQTNFSWEFQPVLQWQRGALETDTDIWITYGNAILQIDLTTDRITIHDHRKIALDIGTDIDIKKANIHGIWADADGTINLFLDNNTGYISWDGNRWALHAINLNFLDLFSTPNVIAQSTTGDLFITYSWGQLFRWNPHLHPETYTDLTDSFAVEGDYYLFDEDDRLWASQSIYDASHIFRQSGALVDTIAIPDTSSSPLSLRFSKNGEAWAWHPEGIYYYGANEVWVTAAYDLEFTPRQPAYFALWPFSAGQAYLHTKDKILLLTATEEGITVTELAELNSPTSRVRKLIFAAKNGDLYYLDEKDQQLWRRKMDQSTPEAVGPLKALPGRLSDLTADHRGEIWGLDGGLYHFTGGEWRWADPIISYLPMEAEKLAFGSDFVPALSYRVINESYDVHRWQQGQWQSLSYPPEGFAPLSFWRHELYVDPNNRPWIIDDNNFGRWEYGRWWWDAITNYFPPTSSRVTDFFVDQDDRQFITGVQQLIVRDGGYYESYSMDDLGFDPGTSSATYLGLRSAIDPDGNIYLAHNFEVRKWLAEGTTALPPFNDIVPDASRFDSLFNGVSKIYAFAEDDIWVSFSEAILGFENIIEDHYHQVAHFDGRQWHLFHPTTNRFAADDRILDIAKDAAGRIWINTGEGVHIVTRNQQASPERYTPIASDRLNVFPNPGCCFFQLHWTQIGAGNTTIKLLDMNGHLVKTITENYFPKGEQTWSFDRIGLPAGTYIVQLAMKDAVLTEKVILLN